MYKKCNLCPNRCLVDRSKEVGICAQSDKVKIAWAGLHKGEEPPISGENGSGMIFFTGCGLKCKYCQNIQLSGDECLGYEVSDDELATIMLELEKAKAASINLVTGAHFIPSIINAIKIAKAKGLTLPIVYNSSGYESLEALALIDPFIDIYLVDFKTLDEEVSLNFCGKVKYKDNIIKVLDFIVKNNPITDFDKNKGVIMRHLVFPNTTSKSIDVLRYFSKHYKDSCYISLMVQFISPFKDITFDEISDEDYDRLLDVLEEEGIEDGFLQEKGDEEIWIPDFNKEIPFPSSYAKVLDYFLTLKK